MVHTPVDGRDVDEDVEASGDVREMSKLQHHLYGRAIV